MKKPNRMERLPPGSAVMAKLGSEAVGARRNDPTAPIQTLKKDVVIRLEMRTISFPRRLSNQQNSHQNSNMPLYSGMGSNLYKHTRMYLLQ